MINFPQKKSTILLKIILLNQMKSKFLWKAKAKCNIECKKQVSIS